MASISPATTITQPLLALNIGEIVGEVEGASFVGYLTSLVLLGWLLSQVWHYCHICHQDHIAVKATVLLLLALEMGNTISVTQGFYGILITNFGNLISLGQISTGFSVFYFLTPFTVLVVQIFFIYRFYRLSNNSAFDTVLMTCSLVAGIGACALALFIATSVVGASFAKALSVQANRRFSAIMNGLSAFCDSVAAWALYRRLSSWRNGIATTERTIASTGSYIMNRGILLLLVQIAAFISFIVSSSHNAFLFFPAVLSKLYANSLLSFLLSFEPHRLSLRRDCAHSCNTTTRDSMGVTPRNIHLEVVQTTDSESGSDKEDLNQKARVHTRAPSRAFEHVV